MRNLSAPLSWTTEAEQAFIQLKQQLSVAPDLAVPDYALPFHLDVSGTGTHVNGILFQKKGEREKSVDICKCNEESEKKGERQSREMKDDDEKRASGKSWVLELSYKTRRGETE